MGDARGIQDWLGKDYLPLILPFLSHQVQGNDLYTYTVPFSFKQYHQAENAIKGATFLVLESLTCFQSLGQPLSRW